MKTITLYEIHEWDGGERQIFRGRAFNTHEAGIQYLKKCPHDAIVKRVTCVFDGLDDMEEHTVARLRESALAKLTDAEKHALGVGG